MTAAGDDHGAGNGGWAMRRLPILTSLREYDSSWLPADLLAGLTLVAIVVPEQLATARLAGMPVVTGLYAFLAGAVMFALLGSNPQMSVGADSTIAPMLAPAVAALALTGSARYTGDMALLALLVGIIIIAVGLARMGWIADFLSIPVTTGFLAGIGLTIIAGQLPAILGVPPTTGNALEKYVHALTHLGGINWYDVVIAATVFVLIVVCERVSPRIPGALIGVALSTIAVAVFDLTAHGVATMGRLPSGLPPLALPPFSAETAWRLLPAALAVALIVITQSSATTRSFAELGDFEVDVNRDFVGVGAGNVLAAFLGAFALNASPPRTAVVRATGGRSQVPGLTAATLVVVLLVAAAGLLTDLPEATLGAVLVYVGLRIFRLHDLRTILAFDKTEFAVAVATLVTVVVLGVGPGILLAVLLAILDRTWRTARPRDALLGRLPGTTVWWSLKERPDGETIPGVIAYRFDAALYFANATRFRDRVRELVAESSPRPRLFVLDASGVDAIDYTGGRELLKVVHELHAQDIDFAVARATGDAPSDVSHAGLRRHIGADHIFITVEEAIVTLGPESGARHDDHPEATG